MSKIYVRISVPPPVLSAMTPNQCLAIARTAPGAAEVPPALLGRSFLLAVLFCCGAFFGWGADVLQGPIRGGFSVAEADPETGQRRFLLRGESATPVSPDEWAIQGVRLEVYGEDGTTNLVFTPARCLYHQQAQRVTSPDELRLLAFDGQMAVQGVGFGLDLVSGRLVVSNQVQATLRKHMLQPESQPGPVIGRGTPGPDDSIEIRSDRLEFEEDQAFFSGDVQVNDAQGWMTCRQLWVDLALETRRAELIVAQDEVALESNHIRAQAGRVTYDPLNEHLELEGDPRWQFGDRAGSAEVVVLNRLDQRIEARGQVELELPARALMPAGLAPRPLGSVADPGIEQPRLVRVRSDVFNFGPDPERIDGRVANFQGRVQVAEQALRLECRELTVEMDDPGQPARRATASGNVVLEQATDRMTCARAVYDAQEARVFLDGGTTWRTEAREGRSDSLLLDLARGRYQAQGEVWMRLAGEGFGAALLPELAAAPGLADAQTASDPRAPRWIEIQSDWFEYRILPESPGFETAVYEGDVQVREGDQFVMTSALLTVRLAADTRQVEELMAAGEVELRMLEPDGYRLARGDRMMYAAEPGTVELTGIEGVEFYIVTADGVTRGIGRRAIYDQTTELLELDGRPVITTPEGELTGNVVRLDRAHGTLSAAGTWRIRLPTGTFRMSDLPMPQIR